MTTETFAMKNNTKIKLPKKFDGMIAEIDFEGRESGYWGYTVAGFQFEGMGGECHTAHEYTQKEFVEMLKTVVPCDCKKCKEDIEYDQKKELAENEKPEEKKLSFEEKLDAFIKENAKFYEGDDVDGWYTVTETGEKIYVNIVRDSVGLDEWVESLDEEMPDDLYLCNGCDEMYQDEMSTGECCEGKTFRVVDKGDMGFR